jgi:hypothetical protein
MRTVLFVASLSLSCAGGALLQPRPYDPVLRWSRAGATQPGFMQDRYECLRESQQQQSRFIANRYGAGGRSAQITDSGLFIACMEARGYERDANGPLAPPGGSEIVAQ